MHSRDLLIDVSRLVWRVWTGRLPTGIDRVCLAYLDHYGPRARAVVQWRGRFRVAGPDLSDRLCAALARGGPEFRAAFRRLLPLLAAAPAGGPGVQGRTYLNIGHTALDDPGLPGWVRRQRLTAVFLIHDLIPITHPEFCRAGEDRRHARRIRNAIACAGGVIGNSRTTLDELAAFAAAEGLAMPPAIDAWISGHAIAHPATPVALDRPWFVTVGTIEGRKNHILLLQVWQRLARRLGAQTPLLVVIGQRGWEAEHALAMLDRGRGLAPHVIERGRCSDEELAALVAGARALLMPSFAEGFGLPVAEALQLGTPVIASDLPVFREIAGMIPTYLDPLDGPGWERAALAFLSDDGEPARQRAALAGWQPPTWDAHFARVTPWLEGL